MIKLAAYIPNMPYAYDPETDEKWSPQELVEHANGCELQIDYLLKTIEDERAQHAAEIEAKDKGIQKLEDEIAELKESADFLGRRASRECFGQMALRAVFDPDLQASLDRMKDYTDPLIYSDFLASIEPFIGPFKASIDAKDKRIKELEAVIVCLEGGRSEAAQMSNASTAFALDLLRKKDETITKLEAEIKAAKEIIGDLHRDGLSIEAAGVQILRNDVGKIEALIVPCCGQGTRRVPVKTTGGADQLGPSTGGLVGGAVGGVACDIPNAIADAMGAKEKMPSPDGIYAYPSDCGLPGCCCGWVPKVCK